MTWHTSACPFQLICGFYYMNWELSVSFPWWFPFLYIVEPNINCLLMTFKYGICLNGMDHYEAVTNAARQRNQTTIIQWNQYISYHQSSLNNHHHLIGWWIIFWIHYIFLLNQHLFYFIFFSFTMHLFDTKTNMLAFSSQLLQKSFSSLK